jgi:hypothetical protein
LTDRFPLCAFVAKEQQPEVTVCNFTAPIAEVAAPTISTESLGVNSRTPIARLFFANGSGERIQTE